MSFFISDVMAKTGTQSQSGSTSLILMLAASAVIFYFMIFYPQQKRAKEKKKMMNSISRGDEVLTTGGLVGRVTKIAKNGYLSISLNNTTEVVIKRDFVAAVLPKGTIQGM